MQLRYFLALVLVAVTSQAKSIAPRSIQRSGGEGDVSLVEFAIHKTIHGRCSYSDKSGRSVKLIYEETEGTITARSLNPSVVDTVSAVRECRAAAAEVPKASEHAEGRTGEIGSGLSPYELNERFQEFARTNYENQQYVQQLQPRFITWLGHLGHNFGHNFGSFSGNTAANNFGLSWGNKGHSHGTLPGINLFAPANQQTHNSISHGNHLDFNHNKNSGPWGVLNSLGSSGSFPFFSFFHPLSSFNNPFSGIGK